MNSVRAGRYLARIGYDRAPRADLRSLFGLQRAHLLAVPFENLDIRRGRRLALDSDALFDKIVERRRGGFCYELNGLFAELLEAIGFEVTRLAARVHAPERGYGQPFAHLALRVRFAAGSYLVDVGFGDSFVRPLRLERRRPTRQGSAGYAIAELADGDRVVMRSRFDRSPSEPQYRFALEPRDMGEFEAMCTYQQTSPDSHFTRQTICSRATPTGRLSLAGERLIETHGELRVETPLDSAEAVDRILAQRFGVVL